jgi:hypothetical protein
MEKGREEDMNSIQDGAPSVNIDELRRRVEVAELRAREVEAEIRLVDAITKRRAQKKTAKGILKRSRAGGVEPNAN